MEARPEGTEQGGSNPGLAVWMAAPWFCYLLVHPLLQWPRSAAGHDSVMAFSRSLPAALGEPWVRWLACCAFLGHVSLLSFARLRRQEAGGDPLRWSALSVLCFAVFHVLCARPLSGWVGAAGELASESLDVRLQEPGLWGLHLVGLAMVAWHLARWLLCLWPSRWRGRAPIIALAVLGGGSIWLNVLAAHVRGAPLF